MNQQVRCQVMSDCRQGLFRLLGVIVLGITLFAGSAAGAELQADIQRIVEEERIRAGTPAMSVVVVRDSQVLVEYASGLADQEAGQPATLNTQFPAASVSKILTAALVMQQVEAGKLDLDESVNSYLEPAFRIRNDAGENVPATLRQLLSHSSGLPVTWSGMIDSGNPVSTLEQHLARGQRAYYPPGERVVYSNNGFALAGYVAARAAGRPFSEYAHSAILEPLAMTQSTFESPWAIGDTLAAAYGHWFRGGSDRTDHANATAIAPAGGLITTAPDLARFALMILGDGELDGVRILRPESVAEMQRMQARIHPESDQGFGLGFAIRERASRRMVWWDGSLSGAAARLAFLPDNGVAVVVLSNLADNEPTAVTARRILDTITPRHETAKYEPSTGQLEKVTGMYRPSGFIDPKYWYLNYLLAFQVKRQGDMLIQSSMMTGDRMLLPVSPGKFKLKGSAFDDSTVLFDGNEMFMGYLRADRIPAWQSPIALAVYAVLSALTIVSLLIWSIRRLVRRIRARPA